MAATPSFCAHLHVPLQSGCDLTLAKMGRGYDVARYERRIAMARGALPGLAVTTDVMAGFPGEEARDAEETLRTCERIGFARMHVFPYSPRPGTRAHDMGGQVHPRERSERAAALRDLGGRMQAAWAAFSLGQVAEVLVERVSAVRPDGPDAPDAPDAPDGPAGPESGSPYLIEGTTRDYRHVRFAGPGLAEGDLATVRLCAVDDEIIGGEFVARGSPYGV